MNEPVCTDKQLPLAQLRALAEEAARAGGKVLLQLAGRAEVREKAPADLVTEADVAAQHAIRECLLGAFPRHGFLAEENESIPSHEDALRWVVDPLDGTANYVHGVAQYAVSVALEQRGEVLVGAIYEPLADHCYTAAFGQGATLNGRPLRVSRVEQLRQAMVSVSLPAGVTRDAPELMQMVEMTVESQAMRRIGSAALSLCSVAAGQYDAFWSYTTKSWDIAAGVLLVREAGGQVTAPDGQALQLMSGQFLAAATEPLHRQVCGVLNPRRP